MKAKQRYLLLLMWLMAITFVIFHPKLCYDMSEIISFALGNKSAEQEETKSISHSLIPRLTIPITSSPLPADLDVDKLQEVKKKLNYLKNYRNPCWYTQDHVLECLPSFLVVGVAKCGTTNLFNLLRTHPQLVAPAPQETYWWQRYIYDKNQNMSIQIYQPRFKSATNKINNYGETVNGSSYHPLLTFDNSPSMLLENVRNKNHLSVYEIKVLIPHVKIIVILREPTARLYSHYNYRRDVFPENNAEHFHKILINDMKTFNSCIAIKPLKVCAYEHHLYKLSFLYGMYDIFVEEWLNVLPREQFLFLRLDDFIASEKSEYQKISKFLGLEQFPIQKMKTPRTQNKKEYKGPMLNKTRTLLKNFHQPHIQKLASILNDSNFLWGEKPLHVTTTA